MALDPTWLEFHTENVDVVVKGGALHLVPHVYELWYNGIVGPLLYKTVQGDFKVTSTVHPRKRTNPSQPVSAKIHLGGLMARSPASGSENYLFIAVGVDTNDRSVETKSTIDGASRYAGPSWSSADAELRLCRYMTKFQLLKRAPGASSWTLADTFDRSDLPPAVEVGPMVYAASSTPDIDVAFDEVHFAPVSSLGDCARD
jgi:hypothetical protein